MTKVTVKAEQEIEVRTLRVEAGVRYWEDATIDGVEDEHGDLVPCRDGSLWKPIIDLATGTIQNWKQGVTANIHYKVCDAGSYYLLDADGNTVASIENDYVPKMLCPEDNGYGDYIIMHVDVNGKIRGFKYDAEDFEND